MIDHEGYICIFYGAVGICVVLRSVKIMFAKLQQQNHSQLLIVIADKLFLLTALLKMLIMQHNKLFNLYLLIPFCSQIMYCGLIYLQNCRDTI